jgi:hypothetical protein
MTAHLSGFIQAFQKKGGGVKLGLFVQISLYGESAIY